MRRRTLRIAAPVVILAAAILAAVVLRKQAAPEPARLLPEADGYLYIDLRPLRVFGLVGRTLPPVHEPDYAAFVQETGFQFERDLDEAAFAIHAPPRLVDADPARDPARQFPRYTEILRGRFDSQRAANYFHKLARSVERYHDLDVYSFPLEGRTVRVALLGVGIAAASNTDGPAAIHFMIDRYKEVALPFGGPSLIRQHYRHVPFSSLVWGIVHLNPEPSASATSAPQQASLKLPGGLEILVPADTVLVASARYSTAIQVKAEAFTSSPANAKQLVDQIDTFLNIFHSLENSLNARGSDPDVKAFFQSLQVQQEKDRAILSASLPAAFLRKAFAEPMVEAIAGPPESHASPTPQSRRHQRKR